MAARLQLSTWLTTSRCINQRVLVNCSAQKRFYASNGNHGDKPSSHKARDTQTKAKAKTNTGTGRKSQFSRSGLEGISLEAMSLPSLSATDLSQLTLDVDSDDAAISASSLLKRTGDEDAYSYKTKKPLSRVPLKVNLSLESGDTLGIFKQKLPESSQSSASSAGIFRTERASHRRRFPGGHDCEDMTYIHGYTDDTLTIEKQMALHDDFSAILAKLDGAPPYAKYFCAIAANGLSHNPKMRPEDKREILNDMVANLDEAVKATSN